MCEIVNKIKRISMYQLLPNTTVLYLFMKLNLMHTYQSKYLGNCKSLNTAFDRI